MRDDAIIIFLLDSRAGFKGRRRRRRRGRTGPTLVVKDRARRKGEVWTILRRRRRAGGVALTVQSVELDDGVLFLPRGCASFAVIVRWTPGPRWMSVSMGRGLKALTREQQASGFG